MLANFRKVLCVFYNFMFPAIKLAMTHIFDAAALDTHQMMMRIRIGDFIMGVLVPQVDRSNNAALIERSDGAIYCRLINRGGERLNDLLHAHRAPPFHKHADNGHAWSRHTEAAVAKQFTRGVSVWMRGEW